MEEEIDYGRLKAEVRKIRYNLFEVKTPMSMGNRLKLLNIMRYNLGLIEDKEKVKKVEYDCEEKKLKYSESIEIGIAIALAINDEIRAVEGEEQVELWNVMKETYYYLARYLFEYFLVAMEFGIPPDRQFIAPRTSVLNRVAREMSKFYYREDRPIMTLSMPQGTGKEQPLSSKILTPTGWIRMGDVRVGTRVIGADGKACRVVGVYPKGIKDVYRVEFNDGTYVDCGLEHLWEVQTSDGRVEVLDTKHLIESEEDYYIRLVGPTENIYNTIEKRQKKLREFVNYSQKIYLKDMYICTSDSISILEEYAECIRSLGHLACIKGNQLLVDFEAKEKKIINIKKVRQEECQCIMVDHPEHLYVTDGYTLTHNTEISKRFMAWAIGKDSHLPNMMISYSASLAKDKFFNGIDALIRDDMGNYGKIFPKLHELYRSAETLSLDYTDEENRKRPHSEYTLYCVGFDGSVTGRTRAHNILYADDLVKDIEEASNTEIMNKKWVEFTGTIKKRMQGRCKMLLVGTMFSINDPLSRTIKYYEEHEPERLIQIRIPGLNENDESNFNYKYGYAITTEMFHEDRDLMDPVSFSCLIQQNPIERAGLLFFEEEFKKYDLRTYERNEVEYERTVAACDVAWGGDDHLSLPIIDEYKNGECILRHWVFVQGSKDETIPKVVEAIMTYGVTYVCFEANNGGDMYADAVEKELKKRGYVCYVTSAKSPTNKSKLDRILAAQGFIKGADASEYRLVIPIRESIRGDKQFNEALNEVFAFNQSTAKNVRTKQHEDAPDSLSMIAINVLGVEAKVGKAVSTISRDMLGI